jgi:transposase
VEPLVPADETWARLRHLGVRRARLAAESVSQVPQMRDLFKRAWPAVLDAARQPFKPATRHAALTVALARAEDGDLGRVPRAQPAALGRSHTTPDRALGRREPVTEDHRRRILRLRRRRRSNCAAQ